MTTVRTEKRAAVLALTLLTLVLGACGGEEEGPEAALRAWVAEGQQAAENKDRGALMDMVADEYADSRGNNRDDIENLLRFYFLRQQKVALLTRIDELTVIGERCDRGEPLPCSFKVLQRRRRFHVGRGHLNPRNHGQ